MVLLKLYYISSPQLKNGHMKKLTIVLLVIAFAACSKPSSTPTPSTPTTPPATTPNYAKNRIPLIGWGIDTFVCTDSNINPIDSFYSYVGTNGQSMINHNGKHYVLWLDTTVTKYDTAANLGILAPVGIGITINDTTSIAGNEFFTYYTYPLTKTDLSGKTYKQARELWFNNSFLNPKALSGAWIGREHK